MSRTLLVVMIPLIIVGGVAVAALTQLSQSADDSVTEARDVLGNDVVGARAWGIADQVSREIAIFVNERLSDAIGWADDREIVSAAASSGRTAERQGLTELTIEELEEQFADDRQMGSVVSADLENNLIDSPDFKEVFFTNKYGYNVAVSNQTSDFVQSDEDWWQQAWEHGLFVDEAEFDDSAGVFAVDLSIRIDQTNGVPVGVMKTSLDIALVQDIADRFVAGDGQYEVTILERLGRFVARTENDHDSNGIMNGAVTAVISRNQRLIDGYEGNKASHPDGYSIDDEAIAGYSHINDHLGEMRPDADMAGFEDAFDWIVVVEQPTEVGFAALSTLEELSTDLSDTSAFMTLVLVAVALIAVVLAVISSFLFSRRITSPIKQLRDAAVRAADETLPAVVSRIDEMGPNDEIPSLDPVEVETGDEVEDLAHSFNTVQQTAADLAAQQARLRRQNVASTFVSMGRRNQNLLSKQLEHINAMEQNESDSETLRRLFQLDHLATRMRRNAESLLVLAGEETPRRFRAPVSVRHLVQAAGGEIEEFGRLEMATIDEASIEGGAASDVAHLLAELLENASRFSPPTTRIQIHGRRRDAGTDAGYVLSIIDEGLGMAEKDLLVANARLSNPVEFDRAPSAYLGLFVVGHLARRHGLAVHLADSTFGGISATVEIPVDLLVEPTAPMPTVTPPAAVDQPQPVSPPAAVGQPQPVTPEPEPVSSPPSEPSIPVWDLISAPGPTDDLAHEPEPVSESPAHELEPEPEPVSEVDPAAPHDPPGLPLTTTMSIPVPPADTESGSPLDGLDTEPAPQWGRESRSGSLFGGSSSVANPTAEPPPPPPPPPVAPAPASPDGSSALAPADPEPRNLASYAESIVTGPVEQEAGSLGTTPSLPPVPPPPPPPPVAPAPPVPAAEVPEAPAPTTPATPAPAAEVPTPAPPPPPAPVAAAPTPTVAPPPPPAPVAEALAPAPAPAADPSPGLTPSGFRKRDRGNEGAPVAAVPAPPEAEPAEVPHRDADTVQASLARFRAGVSQGRSAVQPDDPRAADDGDEP